MDVRTKCHGNPSSSWWEILAWTKEVDRVITRPSLDIATCIQAHSCFTWGGKTRNWTIELQVSFNTNHHFAMFCKSACHSTTCDIPKRCSSTATETGKVKKKKDVFFQLAFRWSPAELMTRESLDLQGSNCEAQEKRLVMSGQECLSYWILDTKATSRWDRVVVSISMVDFSHHLRPAHWHQTGRWSLYPGPRSPPLSSLYVLLPSLLSYAWTKGEGQSMLCQ